MSDIDDDSSQYKSLVRRLTTQIGADKDKLITELEAGRKQAARILIESIGADGPESIEQTAIRAAARIAELEDMLCRAGSRLKAANNTIMDLDQDDDCEIDCKVTQGLIDQINKMLRDG